MQKMINFKSKVLKLAENGDFTNSLILYPSIQQFTEHYPNFISSHFQTFKDHTEASSYPQSLSKFNQLELEQANSKGMSINFSINSIDQHWESKRCNKNVDGINAWIYENDKVSKETQWKKIIRFPLTPSCIIESKRSLHVYRFAKDASIENRKEICEDICDRYTGDKNVIKLCGTLRLPGFYHQKEPNDPFLVKCLYIDPRLVYSEKEMIENFGIPKIDAKEFYKKYASEDKDFKNSKSNSLYERTYEIKDPSYNMKMLSKIAGSRMVNYECFDFRPNYNGTYQIVVNGNPSSCRIDEQGFIGSYDGGSPTWKQWVLRYGKANRSDLKKFEEELEIE